MYVLPQYTRKVSNNLLYDLEKLHFFVKSLKSKFYQNARLEKNIKCVALITMLRGTMHACFSILASKV